MSLTLQRKVNRAKRLAKPRARTGPTEDEIQIQIVAELRARDVLVIHVPNEGRRSKAYAAKLKRMGVTAGVPDLLIFGNHGRCYALELKTTAGRTSPAQRQWASAMIARGYPYACAYGIDEARAVLRDWKFL